MRACGEKLIKCWEAAQANANMSTPTARGRRLPIRQASNDTYNARDESGTESMPGSRSWIRTTIHGVKGRCPTVRRSGSAEVVALRTVRSLFSPVSFPSQKEVACRHAGQRCAGQPDLHVRRERAAGVDLDDHVTSSTYVPVTIVLLDACRDNPFPAGALVRTKPGEVAQPVTAAGLGGPRGAAPLSDVGKAAGEQLGTVLGFAAEPGHAALDGSPGQNSPYVPGVCSKGRACPECTQAAAVKASPLSHTLQDILYKIERRVVGQCTSSKRTPSCIAAC